MKKNIGLIIILWLSFFYGIAQDKHIIILHTNDMHSQMIPIKSGDEKNSGGMLRLAAAVEQVRSENNNVLLFDAGDFWQSTSYFNLFHGNADIDMMNALKYDAVTLGNHQFDLGIDTLIDRLKKADFQILLANFDLSQSRLKDCVKPYTIFEKDDLKIGVIGVCVDLKGLVNESVLKEVIYKDPIPIVNELATMLKEQEKCDIVVVLSHLGYKNRSDVNDVTLAQQSENIDIILGGHTHTNPDQVADVQNKNGKNVIIRQMRKSGIYLGRIDIKK
ncbi:MAG: metallophosphoesterase [Bacteroidales bacterium]|nr:metallophosphoesterase [Bacteroidales bacterium]